MAEPRTSAKGARSGSGGGGGRARPPLRLVGRGEAAGAGAAAPGAGGALASPAPAGEALAGADPRWVLAVRVGEQLQGPVLTPERRQRLVRTGKVMGLTAFDCQLIIAIVQDQARRGHAPGDCPTAGEAQLRLIPRPKRGAWLTRPRVTRMGMAVAAVMAVELALAWWLWLR